MQAPARQRRTAVPVAIAVATAAGALATAAPLACSSLREHTYPPRFNYIPKERLQSTMWRLAAQLSELDRRMRAPDAASRPSQDEVVRLLAEMERDARELGPGGWPSNHPRVSRGVEAFRDDLQAARRAASRTPPDYFLAGRVAGACLHCHEGGR